MQERIRNWILKNFTAPLRYKKILWTKYVKIFCDGGFPIWRKYPRICRTHFSPHWDLKGFRIYIFGREINFVFGEDKKGLYR
jgi:hypothetical protein